LVTGGGINGVWTLGTGNKGNSSVFNTASGGSALNGYSSGFFNTGVPGTATCRWWPD